MIESFALILTILQNNGGTVVPLEKNADILIADHARKDVPAGSYSWKFITESVENGIIQIKDRYRIGRDPDLPRPAGGGVRGTKSTRTPFTIDDDAGLAKWVLAHTVDRTGNKIFQEFESIVSLGLNVGVAVLTSLEPPTYLAVMAESLRQDSPATPDRPITKDRCFGPRRGIE